MKIMKLFGAHIVEQEPTLRVFLKDVGISRVDKERILAEHHGDFKVIRNEPHYPGDTARSWCRDLLIRYNGVELQVSGSLNGKELYLTSPIASLLQVLVKTTQ